MKDFAAYYVDIHAAEPHFKLTEHKKEIEKKN